MYTTVYSNIIIIKYNFTLIICAFVTVIINIINQNTRYEHKNNYMTTTPFSFDTL